MQTAEDEEPALHVQPTPPLKVNVRQEVVRSITVGLCVLLAMGLILTALLKSLPTMKVGAPSTACHLSC